MPERKTIPEEKIFGSVSRFPVNTACMAGVHNARPNFNAQSGRTITDDTSPSGYPTGLIEQKIY